jgi:hypothetical protein
MSKLKVVIPVLALILLVLSGCGLVQPTFVLDNQSGEDWCILTLNGGDNLLAEPLATGETASFDVDAGTYDIYGEACSGISTEAQDETIEAGDEFTWTVSLATE